MVWCLWTTPARLSAPPMLWSDQRTALLLDRWRALPEEERARLSNPLVAGMAGPIVSRLTAELPRSSGWVERELQLVTKHL